MDEVAQRDPVEIEVPDVPEEFHIRNAECANWLLRKVREKRAYYQACAEWCEREQARAKREEEFLLLRYGPELEEWAKARLAAEGGRKKTVFLPAGSCGWRMQPRKLEVTEPDAVLAWAEREAPELIQVSRTVPKSALTGHVEQTGEIPPAGVTLVPAREGFFIR